MYIRIVIILLLSSFIFTGCKSKKKTIAYKKRNTTQKVVIQEKPKEETKPNTVVIKKPPKNISYTDRVSFYIKNYSKIAQEEMRTYGIPASITLAQGILESGAGDGELTVRTNNHFGIKCHKNWTGERAYHDDDEKGECFRKYKDPRNSFRDHSLFLTQRSRYRDLFKLRKDDYKGWARGLKKAGYATDPKYPNKLISLIERYNLAKYDEVPVEDRNKAVSIYTVKKGDTLYSISRKLNITVEELKSFNNLDSNVISVGQELKIIK